MSNEILYLQRELQLPAFDRGFHLITNQILEALSQLDQIDTGLLHIFIKHTSASLTINENADQTVRGDFERFMNHLIKEDLSLYQHTYEGPDDMPAHIKASFLDNSLTIPITSGRVNMGIWQGIYLCEHRNHGGRRGLVLTIQGQKKI